MSCFVKVHLFVHKIEFKKTVLSLLLKKWLDLSKMRQLHLAVSIPPFFFNQDSVAGMRMPGMRPVTAFL